MQVKSAAGLTILARDDFYRILGTYLPNSGHCRSLGLYDHSEVCDAFCEYCIERFERKPFNEDGLHRIRNWFPGTYAKRQRQDRKRMIEIGLVHVPDKYRGRDRRPILEKEEEHGT